MIVQANAQALGRLLRAVLGPAPVPDLAPEVMAWEDDGGRVVPDWEHVFVQGAPRGYRPLTYRSTGGRADLYTMEAQQSAGATIPVLRLEGPES